MVDAKKYLLTTAQTSGVTATVGSLPSTGVDGVPTVLHASQEGVLYVSITDPAGNSALEVIKDQDPAGATPGVLLTGGVFRSTQPTYTDGDAAVFHMDDRGRLLVSYGEGPDTADVEEDGTAAPANPKGAFGITKVSAAASAYVPGDAAVYRSDLYGHLLVKTGGRNSANTTNLEISVETDNDPGPSTPIGTYPLAMYRTVLPTYTNGDATVFHTDSQGRLLVSVTSLGTTIDTDNSPGTATPTGTYSLSKAITAAGFPSYANGDASTRYTDAQGRLFVTLANTSTGDKTSVTTDNDAAPATPTGIWPMAKYQSTLPTYLNNDAAVLHCNSNGVLMNDPVNPGTAAVTNVSASITSVALLAADATRKGATVFNDSASATLYLKFGTNASPTSHTVQVPPGGFYELPSPVYTGLIHGEWDAAVGAARVTEVTP